MSLDWGRWREYQGAHGAMNAALSEVLDALGFEVWPFGLGGAWMVTGRRANNAAIFRMACCPGLGGSTSGQVRRRRGGEGPGTHVRE